MAGWAAKLTDNSQIHIDPFWIFHSNGMMHHEDRIAGISARLSLIASELSAQLQRAQASAWALHDDVRSLVGASLDGCTGPIAQDIATKELETLLSPLDPMRAGGWATTLIARFGSLGHVLAVTPEAQLAAIEDAPMVVVLLQAVHRVTSQLLARRVERISLGSYHALEAYLHFTMAYRMQEEFRVLFLDSKNRLIREETLNHGTIDQCGVYIREIARRSLELGATAIIAVHNHPSGDAQPSKQDIALTKELIRALKPLGTEVHDHLIIGSSGQSSMRGLGLI